MGAPVAKATQTLPWLRWLRRSSITNAETRQVMVELESTRKLVLRQEAIEEWLAEWRSAQSSRT
jgi:hypothetical protein